VMSAFSFHLDKRIVGAILIALAVLLALR